MGKFRIAMVAACPFPANHGSSASIREMSEAMAKRGHQVHVVTYPIKEDIPCHGFSIHRILPHFQGGKVRVGPSKHKLLFDPLMVVKLCQVIWQEKIDLIHAHNYEGALIGFAARLLTGRPLLYNGVNTMRDELPGYGFIRPRWLAAGLGQVLDFVVPRLGNFVTVVSNELYLQLRELGVPDRKLAVIPAGVYEDLVAHGDPHRVRRELGLDGRPLVLYTGALEHFQRIDYLFQAMAVVAREMPEARLLVMANAVSDIAPFEAMVRDMGLTDRVIFSVNLPFSDLRDFLAAADVTVVPRPDTPGFPVKLLNYMAAAKPTVTFQGSAKGVTHLFNGLVIADHDAQALGAGLVTLLKDPELARRLGENARQVLRTNFDWDFLAEIIEQIYEEMLGRRTDYRLVHPLELGLRQKLGLPVIFYDTRRDHQALAIPERRRSQRPIDFPNCRRLVQPLGQK